MQPPRRYKQAPIIEAILDLRVTLPGEAALDKLLQVHERVRDDYPVIQPLLTGSVVIQPGMLVSVGATQQHSGFRFLSQDGSRVFQVTLNGFTCNRLRPYDTWEVFRDEARRLW
ncbi:MAG: TIGR04255 family protein, partial [Ktedonobacterales bacterium]